MSGFSAEWLALREPADAAARSTAVTTFVADAFAERSSIRIVDLGSGTGANLRYLEPRLVLPQAWRLVDHDAALLARARTLAPMPFEAHVVELQHLDDLLFAERDLVTASALLDLVSDRWLHDVVERSRRTGCAVLFVLNYDGRIECTPQDPDDDLVRDLVNRHQQTDKGFGPALGPTSGARAESVLRAAGYVVRREPSDWILDAEQAELQRQLIAGWASAAIALSASDDDRIHAWEQRRLEHVTSGASRIVVGHDDVGAVLR